MSVCRPPASGVSIVALLVITGLLCGCEAPYSRIAADLPFQKELSAVRVIAVVPLRDAPGANGSGEVVVSNVMEELYAAQGIRLVERNQLKSIIVEQDIKISQLSDPAEATKLGKLAGADAVLVGELLQYQGKTEASSVTVDIFSHSGTSTDWLVGIGVRLVRVADARIIYCRTGQGKDSAGFGKAARLAAKETIGPLVQFYANQHGKTN